jgi:hypothetical protein
MLSRVYFNKKNSILFKNSKNTQFSQKYAFLL